MYYTRQFEKDLEPGLIPMDIDSEIPNYIELVSQLRFELSIISEKLNIIVNTLKYY